MVLCVRNIMKRTLSILLLVASLIQMTGCAAAPAIAMLGGAQLGAMSMSSIWAQPGNPGDSSRADNRGTGKSRQSHPTVLASNKPGRNDGVPLTGASLVVPAPVELTTGSERPRLRD